jgi:hypothetical protein
MLRYRYAAALSAGLLLVLPALSSAQETDPIPGFGLPAFDISVDFDVSGPTFDPPAFEGPEVDFSLSIETDVFDVEVTVQLAPGDPIPDVDVTLKSKVGNPPPPPPPPPDDEGGSCMFGFPIC